VIVESKLFTLKDGRSCLLRSARIGDADNLIAFMVLAAAESPYLISYPDEISVNAEFEGALIERISQSADEMLLIAEYGGRLAGFATTMKRTSRRKVRHRIEMGITVKKSLWGKGIGRQLIQTIIEASRAGGLEQIELGVFAGNERARRLYEAMGFVETGFTPNAAKLDDGTVLGEYRMMRTLTE